MNVLIVRLAVLVLFLISLNSCDGECINKQIEKVEWVTDYEDKTKEVLVSYTILENKTQFYENTKELTHTIIIKNDDTNYSNNFAVTINYGFQPSDGKKKDNIFNSDYVEIPPGKTHTFNFDRQSKFYYNFNSNIIIRQKPYILNYKKRTDKLRTEKIMVNSCEVSIESLEEKFKTVKELYNSKTLQDEKDK